MSTVASMIDSDDQRTATREMLLAAVERARPVLEANANQAERLRTLSKPAWRALHDEGLFVMKAPRELGGVRHLAG
jgi:hypothetical protein